MCKICETCYSTRINLQAIHKNAHAHKNATPHSKKHGEKIKQACVSKYTKTNINHNVSRTPMHHIKKSKYFKSQMFCNE